MPPLNSVVSLSVSARARLPQRSMYNIIYAQSSKSVPLDAASVRFMFIAPQGTRELSVAVQYNII